MSDSVGKISLDLELQGDLGKQINEAAGKIGEQLKASLQNIGNINFKALADNISNSLKKSIDGSMDAIKGTIEKTLNSALAGATAGAKKIKIPVDFGIPINSLPQKETAVSSLAQPRAPPIPKIKTGVNIDVVKSQIDNLSQSLDITNAKIEQQREKLAQLRESYDRAFDGSRKNKLHEQILNTEAAINKLTAQSDKTGFKLADLDEQFQILSNSAKQATSGVNVVNNKLKETASAANKSSKSLFGLGKSTKESSNNFNRMQYGLGRIMRQFFTWMVVLPLVMKGLTGMATFLGQAFMANTQFANSLNQIKSNLYTAFMPIYQAALPAINALMAGLSRITAYIASFTNTLFGKTYNQSFQAAKGLIAAKTEMGAYGNAAKKAAKDAKGALAGFDEINQLQSGKGSDNTSGGSDKIPKMVMPSVDTSTLDKTMGVWADKFKKVLGTIFQPFKNAWQKHGAGVSNEFKEAIEGSKDTLGNFFNMLATPPVQKFLENIGSLVLATINLGLKIYDGFILPIVNWFIVILPGAANGLNPIVDLLTRFVDYLGSDGFKYVQVFLSAVIGLVAGIKTFNIIKDVIAWFSGLGALIMGTVIPNLGALWATMMANPIALVIAIIVGLIATFVTLYNTNERFRNAVNSTWANMRATFISFGSWLNTSFSTDWTTRFGILGGVVNGFFYTVNSIFQSVKQVFNGITDFVAGVFTGNWRRAWEGIRNVFSGIVDTFGVIMRAPLNAVIGLINGAISSINRIKVPKIDLPFGMGTVGGWNLSIPRIPYLAKGGIIDQPTLAMVGERGKEAVMPLENNTGWIDDLAYRINSKSQSSDEVVRLLKIIIDILKNLGMDINLDGEKLGNAAIKSINKDQRIAGKTLIKV